MSELRLIVGLGNPGKGYEYTRHNLGFLVVRQLAEVFQLKFSLSSFTNGLVAEGKMGNHDVCLLMPLTYMNKSGVAVAQAMRAKEIGLDNVLVICDDLNLSFKQLRVRSQGSDGGNNGLASIIERVESQKFARLRMGIGQPKSKGDTVDYVLEEFSKAELNELNDYIKEASRCVGVWLKDGTDKAMAEFNRKSD